MAALPAAIFAAEHRIRGQRFETAILFDPSGNEVARVDGTRDRVDLAAIDPALFPGNILIHNHPRGWTYPPGHPLHAGHSFSDDDIFALRRHHLAEIRAVTPLDRYSMKPPLGGWGTISVEDLHRLYHRHAAGVRRAGLAAIRAGTLTPDEATAGHFHEIWERVARETGMIYVKEPGR